MKRKSIDAVPIWFVPKKIKPEKCVTGDTLAPEKKALMITGDARGSQRVKLQSDLIIRAIIIRGLNSKGNLRLR